MTAWIAPFGVGAASCVVGGSCCGNDAVEDHFDRGEVGGFCAGIASAADCDADAFAFGFVRCVCGNNAQICDRLPVGDCTFLNESDGFRASRNIWVNASCKSSNFFSSSRYLASLPVSGWTALLLYLGYQETVAGAEQSFCSSLPVLFVVSVSLSSSASSCVCCAEKEKCDAVERVLW